MEFELTTSTNQECQDEWEVTTDFTSLEVLKRQKLQWIIEKFEKARYM
jgi:hypothetical protein